MLESPRRLLDCMFYRDDEVARLGGGEGMPVDLASRRCFRFRLNPLCAELFCFHSKNTSSSSKKEKNLPKNKRCLCFLSDCRKIIAKSSFRSCPLAGLLGDDVRLAQACARAGCTEGPRTLAPGPVHCCAGQRGSRLLAFLPILSTPRDKRPRAPRS